MKEYKKSNYARRVARGNPSLRLYFKTGQFVLSRKALELMDIPVGAKLSIFTQNGAIYIALSEKDEDGWTLSGQKSGTGKFMCRNLMEAILFDLTLAKNGKPSIVMSIDPEPVVIGGRKYLKAVKS